MDEESTPEIDPFSLLGIYPTFLQLELVESDEFRERMGLQLDGTISLNQGQGSFRRSAFFEAVRRAFEPASGSVTLADEAGELWELRDEGPHLALEKAGVELHVGGLGTLSPDPLRRIREFEEGLAEAGLLATAIPGWRDRVEARRLTNDETRELSVLFEHTPVSVMRALSQEMAGSAIKASSLVPAEPCYFERLCGAGHAGSIEDLATNVVPGLVDELLKGDVEEGGRLALLLSAHGSFLRSTKLIELPSNVVEGLLGWALTEADLVSKIGAIELGLEVLPRAPELVSPIKALVEQVIALDPHDPNGRLQLLMGLFVFVYGELSRTKVLEHWPPFRRRFAALAQASLIERVALGRLDVEGFTKWAMQERGQRYYHQVLVELREEPRWLPDDIGADQLKNEFLGRIYDAAGRRDEHIPEGALRELLAREPGSPLAEAVHFPGSFMPGPLEGADRTLGAPVPAEFEAILDENLGADRLTTQSVIALINLRGLFTIDGDKVERAVKLIRNSRHRFADEVDIERRDIVIAGLARLAATARHPALADDVRMMMRKNRVDKISPPSADHELMIGITAAAAHREYEPWSAFAGEWARELAFAVKTKEEASRLATAIGAVCSVEPRLRFTMGRAAAAVDAFLQM